MTDPTAHWSPSEVDDPDDDRASYPPPAPGIRATTFTARAARTYLALRALREAQRECSQCGAVDPPTTDADAMGGERVTVHDECPARDGIVLPTLHERSIPLLGADECRDACEAVIALTEQLTATEAEARVALDALHKRCDAAEAEVGRLRAALAAAEPVLLLDAVRRDPPPDDIAFPEPERHPVTASRIDHRTAPRFAEAFDGDAPPHRLGVTTPPTDDELSDEAALWIVTAPHSAGYAVRVINAEDARRYRDTARGVHVWHLWDEATGCPAPRPAPASAGTAAGESFAAEHPYAAGAMHGGIAHRSEVKK